MLRNIKYRTRLLVVVMGLAFVVGACSKSKGLAEDPYAGGKEVLDIGFVSKTTDPDIVEAGSTLDLKVRGLMKYKDAFKLFVNEIEAEVLNYTDTTIQFVVPLTASTGSVWITANDQSFFGPIVKIGGKVSLDPTFKVINGASTIGEGFGSGIFSTTQLPNGNIWLTGYFNNFEQQGTEKAPNGGIVQIGPEGNYTTSGVSFGIGVEGGLKAITSINRISSGAQNGKFIIAGSFNAYNSRKENRRTIGNITRLNANGSLDTVTTTEIVNPKPEITWKDVDTIPAFNGGVLGFIRKTFVFGEKVYAIGSFTSYVRMFLPNSSYDEKVYDMTRMSQLVRMNMDGSMDSTFHFNREARQSPVGANGGIADAIMQADGKLILVGNFTTFNNEPANRIVRLNLDGSVDKSFQSGAAANGDIYSIRYNANTTKIIVTGNFTTYNGKPSSTLAVLNADGSVDDTFKGELISGGGATFAAQLNSGKILVTGSFNKYGSYLRQGFMILEPDGKLAVSYNNTGGFQGRVYDMIETENAKESKVILVGEISRFNAAIFRNILRINISK